MESLLGIKRADGQIDWEEIRSHYPIVNWDKIYLNSGSAGVLPTEVRTHLVTLIEYLTTKAPYEVWKEWQPIKKQNLDRLASLTGAKATELQVVRNTTEALNMIIYGIPLSPGDEVITATYDYPFALNAWHNRAARDGVQIKSIDAVLPLSDDEILEAYDRSISDRTKVLHLTHITHREGHILPLQRIVKMAHERGIQVVVDGAHVVGHIDLDLSDIGCDYYASSLHKWLSAPLGTGLLYVREDRLHDMLMHPSSYENARDSMNRYEHLGTRQWAHEIAIGKALDFLDFIGMSAKHQRLTHLKKYWTDQVKELDRVKFVTFLDDHYSGAISTICIDGLSAGQVLRTLSKDFDIHAKSVSAQWGSGVRISPNLFTSEAELDRLVEAVHHICKQ